MPQTEDFYVTSRRRLRRDDLHLRVRPHLSADSWQVWGGLPVCTIGTIISDLLGEHEDESAVAQVVRDAMRDGLVDPVAVSDAAQGHARAYGHRTTSDLVALLVGAA